MQPSIGVGPSLEVAQRVLSGLRERGIAPTPQNYLVWYTHFTGSNPALSRLIRLLESNGDGFSEKRCDELYERFFSGCDEAKVVHVSATRMREIVEQVGESMSVVRHGSNDYSEVLSNASATLAAEVDPQVLLDLVLELQSRTDNMQKHASSLQEDLDRSSREIESLRHDLVSVRKAAYTDQLTGLGNRKLFDEVLRQEITNAVEEGTSLVLLVADIDDFKGFNDQYGHQVGDVVLRLVASKLKASLKGRDTVARYGGEEFAIILPKTELDGGRALAERPARGDRHQSHRAASLRTGSRHDHAVDRRRPLQTR